METINTIPPVHAHYKSLYLNVNVLDLLVLHTQDCITLVQSLSQYSLNEVLHSYICVYFPPQSIKEIESYKVLDRSASYDSVKFLDTLLIPLLAQMPHLQEITLECNDTYYHRCLLEDFSEKGWIYMHNLVSKYSSHTINMRIIVNTVPLISHLESCMHTARSVATSSSSNTPIVLTMGIDSVITEKTHPRAKYFDKNFFDYMSSYSTQNTNTIPLAHISFDWDIEEIHREEIYHYVLSHMNTWGFSQYQLWNFARSQQESGYLRSVYAMQSYLGYTIGSYVDNAISWIEGSENAPSYLATMKSLDTLEGIVLQENISSLIVYEAVNPMEELDMRILQGEHAECISIPHILHTKLESSINVERYLETNGYELLDPTHPIFRLFSAMYENTTSATGVETRTHSFWKKHATYL